MADSSDVDAAVVGVLIGDTGPGSLAALMPDGVFFDVAAHGATRFVIVKLLAHVDAYMFQDSAWEDSDYLVKAVALSTSGADVKAAAARIHLLLKNAVLSPAGYTLMRLQRTERVRYTEVDDDTDARWQHRGGRYAVMVSPS